MGINHYLQVSTKLFSNRMKFEMKNFNLFNPNPVGRGHNMPTLFKMRFTRKYAPRTYDETPL